MLEEPELVSYLRRRFAADAIVLVGSRASGHATPHSDWDVKVFADVERRQRRKLQLQSAFVDLEVHPVPLPDGFTLWHPLAGPHYAMRILHDPTGVAAAVVARTLEAYEAGPAKLDGADYQNRRIFLAKAVLKLSDVVDDPLLSCGYVGKIFTVALLYWFAVRDQWPRPEAEALTQLKELDPAYFAQISILANGASTTEKLRAAEWIYGALFEDVAGHAQKPAALLPGA